MALPSGWFFFNLYGPLYRDRLADLADLDDSTVHRSEPDVERPLSELEDEALQIIWDRELASHFEFRPNSLEAIKRWLTDPCTEELREKITELRLDILELEAIPPLLSQFPRLKVLDLSHNRIRSIPDSLKTLSELEILDLSDNEISSFDFFNVNPLMPQAIFPKLSKLKLAHNQISNLHGLLNICRQLRHLDISFNPIQFDPVRDYAIGCEFVVLPSRGSLKIEETGIDLKLIAKVAMRIAMTDVATILSLLPPRKGPER